MSWLSVTSPGNYEEIQYSLLATMEGFLQEKNTTSHNAISWMPIEVSDYNWASDKCDRLGLINRQPPRHVQFHPLDRQTPDADRHKTARLFKQKSCFVLCKEERQQERVKWMENERHVWMAKFWKIFKMDSSEQWAELNGRTYKSLKLFKCWTAATSQVSEMLSVSVCPQTSGQRMGPASSRLTKAFVNTIESSWIRQNLQHGLYVNN